MISKIIKWTMDNCVMVIVGLACALTGFSDFENILTENVKNINSLWRNECSYGYTRIQLPNTIGTNKKNMDAILFASDNKKVENLYFHTKTNNKDCIFSNINIVLRYEKSIPFYISRITGGTIWAYIIPNHVHSKINYDSLTKIDTQDLPALIIKTQQSYYRAIYMTATALSLLVFIIVYVLLTAKTIKVEDDSYQEQKPIFL